MSQRVYNFGAGPAMLPTEVMEEVQQEMLDYQGHGASIIEISHRAPPFLEILEETEKYSRLLASESRHLGTSVNGISKGTRTSARTCHQINLSVRDITQKC